MISWLFYWTIVRVFEDIAVIIMTDYEIYVEYIKKYIQAIEDGALDKIAKEFEANIIRDSMFAINVRNAICAATGFCANSTYIIGDYEDYRAIGICKADMRRIFEWWPEFNNDYGYPIGDGRCDYITKTMYDIQTEEGAARLRLIKHVLSCVEADPKLVTNLMW